MSPINSSIVAFQPTLVNTTKKCSQQQANQKAAAAAQGIQKMAYCPSLSKLGPAAAAAVEINIDFYFENRSPCIVYYERNAMTFLLKNILISARLFQ